MELLFWYNYEITLQEEENISKNQTILSKKPKNSSVEY
jgi:hypothetical protein